MTQQDQTLALLRARGPAGLHTFEMRQAFIGNPSERIARLELRGHRIRVSEKERLNGRAWGVRYFLEFDAERDGGTSDTAKVALDSESDEAGTTSAVPLSAGLFDAEPFERRPSGAYHEEAA